jgi:hypothetical protein
LVVGEAEPTGSPVQHGWQEECSGGCPLNV